MKEHGEVSLSEQASKSTPKIIESTSNKSSKDSNNSDSQKDKFKLNDILKSINKLKKPEVTNNSIELDTKSSTKQFIRQSFLDWKQKQDFKNKGESADRNDVSESVQLRNSRVSRDSREVTLSNEFNET